MLEPPKRGQAPAVVQSYPVAPPLEGSDRAGCRTGVPTSFPASECSAMGGLTTGGPLARWAAPGHPIEGRRQYVVLRPPKRGQAATAVQSFPVAPPLEGSDWAGCRTGF